MSDQLDLFETPIPDKYQGIITLDMGRDSLLTDFSKKTLSGFYMEKDEGFQERFARAAAFYGSNSAHAQRLYDGASRFHFMYSSPLLSNAPMIGMGKIGEALGISCFVSDVADTREGLVEHEKEIRWLTMVGGGCGAHWNTRAESDKSNGVIPFQHCIDAAMAAYAQSTTRKGSYAAYMNLRHPNTLEFLLIRTPSGDAGRKCLGTGYHHAAIITAEFMNAVKNGEIWEFIDPHDGTVRNSMPARALWELLLETRLRTGEPYFFFKEAAQRDLPQHLKDRGFEVKSSNLCVSGDTMIRTKEGDFPISSLVGKEVEVWNGHEWSLVVPRKTSDSSKMIRVEFGYGKAELVCTKHHRFYIQTLNGTTTRVNAGNLVNGDILEEWLDPETGAMTTMSVSNVEDVPGFMPTYCFTESKRGRGMFAGVVTGQCGEIFLPTTPERTAVCCLSSLNAEKHEEWDERLPGDIIEMLDNVIEDFIARAPKELWRAVKTAKEERAVGLGMMGFHYALQSRNIAIESEEARVFNGALFKDVRQKAEAKSRELAVSRGEPLLLKGTGRRNLTLMAIAPNANSGIIANTSPSIEPVSANFYTHRTRAGSFPVKNKYLERRLKELGHDDSKTWKSIMSNGGSVQHLDFLSQHDKKMFKTAAEIDQRWLVLLAADRNPYVDQGQSLNLFFQPGCKLQYVSDVHRLAFERGLKSLYYLRSKSSARADDITKQAQRKMLDVFSKEPLHKRIINRLKKAWKGDKVIEQDAQYTISNANNVAAGSISADRIASGSTLGSLVEVHHSGGAEVNDDGACHACEG